MRLLINAAVLCCVCAATLIGADPFIGTWKMNIAKSKFSPGPAPQSATAVYSQEGDWIVIKSSGVDATGKPLNRTNRFKRDGKEYPFEGPQGKGAILVTRIDDHTAEAVMKYPGGHTTTIRSIISKDGKTRTMTNTGTNAKGEKVNSVQVWERQ